MIVINLTQHKATPEQEAAGVHDMPEFMKSYLDFNILPTKEDIDNRARDFMDELRHIGALKCYKEENGVVLATPVTHAMIGGAPFFMSALEKAVKDAGLIPVYAFSTRESVEVHNEDGTVTKTAIFKHRGFVEV